MEDKVEEKEKRPPGFDYENTFFYMMRPCSSSIETMHKPKSKAEHATLIKQALDKKLYLWYSSRSTMSQLLIDFDSVPDVPYSKLEQAPKPPAGYMCPLCGKNMTSKSGYTLHLKQKHNNG